MEPKQTVINLTSHPIRIRRPDGSVRAVIEPSGEMARLSEYQDPGLQGAIRFGDGDEDWATVEVREYGAVKGLPEPDISYGKPARWYIVPLLTALGAKAAGRTVADLLVPGAQTRDESGAVNGCLTLAVLALD